MFFSSLKKAFLGKYSDFVLKSLNSDGVIRENHGEIKFFSFVINAFHKCDKSFS